MPTTLEALTLAQQHYQAGRLQDAEELCRQVVAAEPNHPDAIHLLGVIHCQTGNTELAVEYIERAIALQGNNGVYHNSLGMVFKVQGKLDEAVACYRRALELMPDLAEAHNNLGNAFQGLGKLDEAIACYDDALRIRADYGDAHLNRGIAWLKLGDWRRGWPEYEWRWKTESFRQRRAQLAHPEWDGSPQVDRTILLYGEQGFGDTLHMIRYVPLVRQRVGRVIVAAPRVDVAAEDDTWHRRDLLHNSATASI